MRQLITAMIEKNQDLPRNSLVVEMSLEKAALPDDYLVKDYRGLRQIRLTTSGLVLEVRLLKGLPARWLKKDTSAKPSKAVNSRALAEHSHVLSVNQAALQQFLAETGDQNPLHQTAPYILPGALLMEEVSSWLTLDYRRLSLRFYAPAVVSVPIQLVMREKTISLYQAGELVAKGELHV
ncbi:hypothetical protein [Streptococcus equi]|uniref:hypothetical protein n=1 Tax=Streptococcus equi TaxID=1336 RepID=UPI0005B982DD|nr:hypothetical protein [Streptococcus equi]HEL0597696.1 hypothetical protein [Streptococcus equi subsp. zooepidemicus]KIS17056.1 hypothetical protein AT49_01315 [Streptococcus equi subsp. zooepidemicus SzAM35]HEL0631727.1 hypothetical protein [Streptococcus equi subsp. zooepidemicus]HEL1097229.1 hypothetical protein [Streptococcus equi subsp. zooepidemicus]HEL1139250.1 hypothetical protein [Streptococcus equi subsp. zooepidemicus]